MKDRRRASNDVTLRLINASDTRAIDSLLDRQSGRDERVARRVRTIVDRVRTEGDVALLGYARQLDGVTGGLEISRDEMRAEAMRVAPAVRRAVGRAARNIARVASRQVPRRLAIRVAPGVHVEQRIEPLARVGCYVPGGRFPLPSSLLMTAVRACRTACVSITPKVLRKFA